MPRGMRQLKHLKTFSLFVISKNERDGQLDELKELDIVGSLTIKNLGRVSDASMERGISMAKKTSINALKLEWRSINEFRSTIIEDDDNESKRIRDEKIGEALEVSTARLKKLKMIGYRGVNLTKLVGKSSPFLTRLELSTIASNSVDNEMIVLFPLLEKLVIKVMKNLRVLVSPTIPSAGAFPNLSTLFIYNCPKLGALPPHLKSLKRVTLRGECSDELLYSISNLNGTLTHLNLSGLNNDVENGIFTVNNNMNEIEVELFPLLEKLDINNVKNLRELVSGAIPSAGAFPNLSSLHISNCPKLGALPPNLKSLKDVSVSGGCSDELFYSISNLNDTLTDLTLHQLNNDVEHIFSVNNNMNGIEVVLFPLLEKLNIWSMKNLRELVSPTIPSAGAFLNLCTMFISNCPKLGALPTHLKSLKHIRIDGKCSDKLLYSISNLSALTHLHIENMNERSVLFGAGYMTLIFDDEAQLGGGGVRSTNFQSLQSLYISSCKKLRRLFDEGMISKISGCQNKHFFNSLTEFTIYKCPELMISVEEFENLNINNSLQRLWITKCPKLVSSEEADDFIALLRSLRTRLDPVNFIADILLEEE
ncbi:uncharacterized protein LOC124942819 [Impatiens glandulifera]|uniref:uncharacterized protein LOC124942819 n=1 Tax=Impatiens glandulifera TaxID=253017 RepID=UPI001FB0E8FB|nr:uncharacterized protein LOC124942819 [Impatiens glandulifera]